MAEHYEVVKDAPGFGSRIIESIKGILIGIVLFIVAFPVLWWGENRQNLAEFIKKGTLIESDVIPSVPPNTLIKTIGKIHSNESVNDPKYLAQIGDLKLLKLHREVEMYAWVEEKKTEKRGDKEVTTYDYKKDWTGSAQDSGRFYDAANHRNPPMAEKDLSLQVRAASIGNLPFDASQADLHGSKELTVAEAMLNKNSPQPLQASGGVIYIPFGVAKGTTAVREPALNPELGDLRLSYTYFENDVEGSVVGDWDGRRIVSHIYKETHSYLGAYPGSLLQFRAQLQSEHTMMSWIIRIVAFMMLWGGLNMILGPILMVLESIPIVGGAGKAVISVVTGLIALVLWGLTIFLANLWLVLLVVAVLLGGVLFYLKKVRKPAVASAA